MGNRAHGWRLPAVAVMVALVALVAFARLGMKPTSTGPAVTVNPTTAAPTEAAALPPTPATAPLATAAPSPTEQGVTLTTLAGPDVEFIKPTAFTSPISPWPGRFADGIPSVINGEAVHRINETLNLAVFSNDGDSGSILIGGWFGHVSTGIECDQPACIDGRIADSPLQVDSQGVGVDGAGNAPNGAIVIRGAAHTKCAPPIGQRLMFLCLYSIRADDVVWAGDEYTSAAPIDAAPLLREFGLNVRGFEPEPYHDQPTCLLPRPAQAYRSETGKVQFVFVFASTAERVAGATSLLLGPPYGDIGSGCDKRPPLDGKSGWISVANVIVRVSDVDGGIGDKVRRILGDLAPVGIGG